MSVGSVVVAFEGSYASYRGQQVPSWTSHYRARRFADVIYATPASDLMPARSACPSTAGSAACSSPTWPGRPIPTAPLPSYWSKEVSDVAAGCTG